MNAKKKSTASTGTLESTNLILFLIQWRWHIAGICFLAAVASAIASFMIEEKYKSAVILFAAPQNSIGEQFYEETKKNDLLEYGEKEDAERLLQVLQSDRIRSRIIAKYNLWEHYEIDPADQGANTMMQKEYDSNVSSRMTKFGSIEVVVLDKVNTRARDMANDIALLADSVSNQMRNERAQEAFQYVSGSLNQVKEEIRVMEDSLGVLYALGLYDFSTQIEGLNEQYATAIIQGQPTRAETIRQQMDMLSQHATSFNKLSNLIEAAYEREAILKKRYDLMSIDATSQMPSTFVVDRAAEADRKAYPVRWLIVAVSVIAAFVFSVISILILDNFRTLKAEGRI